MSNFSMIKPNELYWTLNDDGGRLNICVRGQKKILRNFIIRSKATTETQHYDTSGKNEDITEIYYQ